MNDMGAIPIPPEAAEAFFRQQESLHADHIRSIARGRRAAWWVAGSAVAVAVLEAAAIASLAPIHDVEWRLVRVDSATGVIDEVNQLREAPKTVNEANTRFALGQYVRLREGYAAPEAEYNFRAVSLMSVVSEQRRYADTVKGGNPNSPQAQFGKGWLHQDPRGKRVGARFWPGPGAVHPRGAEGQRGTQGHKLDRDDRL